MVRSVTLLLYGSVWMGVTLTMFISSHTDETEFRNFIVWLEDQKIRHYKIEDRGNLRNIHNSEWSKQYETVSL